MKKNKIIMLIINIIKIIIWLLLFCILILVLFQRFDTNRQMTLEGYRMFNVVSSSMIPDYEVGDIIITKECSFDDIDIGDDITYLGEKNDLSGLIITHRVVLKDEKNNRLVTKGIASDYEDPKINYSQVYGKVVYKSIILSFISKLMNNEVAYYAIFMVIGIMLSINISGSIYEKKVSKDDLSGRKQEISNY